MKEMVTLQINGDTYELLTEFEVRRAIAGNLCRCTGYVKIVEEILTVSQAE